MSYTIPIPESGCSVFYGTYLDHYASGVRSRYYLNYNQLVLSSTSSYTSLPSGLVCLPPDSLIYKPEVTDVYFPLLAILAALFLFYLAYKLIIYPFWRKK